MNWLVQLSISDLTNLSLLLVTVVVSIFGVYQFYSTTHFNRNQAAKAIHAEYIKLALDNPTLANPEIKKIDYDALILGGSREDFERYEWFVSFMLLSFEEIFCLSADSAWAHTLESNLRVHSRYFQSSHFQRSGYIDNIDPSIRKLILQLPPP